MALPHGNPRWTNTELRAQLELAHNSARDKWGAYLSDLALAYWDAYKHVSDTLKEIEAFKNVRKQQAELFWSIILPAVAGGFLGGLVSLKLKPVLQETGIKFIEHSLVLDTGKAVTSDVAKYSTKQIEASFKDAAETNPWKPTAVDPAQFAEILRNQMLHTMLRIDDGLIDAQKSSSQAYRDRMFVLYNSPFIWNAPEEKDLDKWKGELWRPLEVFLWADWANHRDTEYWVDKILEVTDDPDQKLDREFNDFNPILDRLIQCKVPQWYITQYVPSYWYTNGDSGFKEEGHRVLNILWVRHLAPHYQNTLLGKLLNRIQPGRPIVYPVGGTPASAALEVDDLSLRPGSYRLM